MRARAIPPEALDLLLHLPLKQSKQGYFEQVRERFLVDPARSFVCGDEHQNYTAALAAGMHPIIVSSGFGNRTRLTRKSGVSEVLISSSPAVSAGV